MYEEERARTYLANLGAGTDPRPNANDCPLANLGTTGLDNRRGLDRHVVPDDDAALLLLGAGGWRSADVGALVDNAALPDEETARGGLETAPGMDDRLRHYDDGVVAREDGAVGYG